MAAAVQPTVPDGPNVRWFVQLWHAVGLLWWSFILIVCNRVTIEGGEHRPVRGEGGVLILANHPSAIDPFLIGVTAMPFFSPIRWWAPAKAELFQIPVIGALLRSWGAIPVRRGEHDRAAMTRIVDCLKTDVLVAFPEGARSSGQQLLPGRPGIGKIIYDARPRKILPVAIVGSDTLLPKGRVLPKLFQPVTIRYGRPIDLNRYDGLPDSVDTSQRIVDDVMREIATLLATTPRHQNTRRE